MSTRPAVVVSAAGDAGAALREVCAGLEEEGVPFRVVTAAAGGDAAALAHDAARRSQVSVGVGLDAAQACVQVVRSDGGVPVITLPDPASHLAVARALGHDAARLVKGVPLKLEAATVQ